MTCRRRRMLALDLYYYMTTAPPLVPNADASMQAMR
jgi:hypothetical protein